VPVEPYINAESALARRLEEQGRWAEAVHHWRRVEAISPNAQVAGPEIKRLNQLISKKKAKFLEKGEAERVKGNTKSARRYFLKVLALDGSDGTARRQLMQFERSQALNSQSHKDEAALMAQMTQRISGNPPLTLEQFEGRAQVALASKNYPELLKISDAFLEVRPRHKAALKYKYQASVILAEQHRLKRQLSTAIGLIDSAQSIQVNGLKVSPVKANAIRAALAVDLDLEGRRLQNTDIDKAIEHWTKALSYQPNMSRTKQRLVRAKKMRDRLRMITSPGN
jgi:tetratricopeptide (TPR) repeat protein